jgi:hypothetical protein
VLEIREGYQVVSSGMKILSLTLKPFETIGSRPSWKWVLAASNPPSVDCSVSWRWISVRVGPASGREIDNTPHRGPGFAEKQRDGALLRPEQPPSLARDGRPVQTLRRRADAGHRVRFQKERGDGLSSPCHRCDGCHRLLHSHTPSLPLSGEKTANRNRKIVCRADR